MGLMESTGSGTDCYRRLWALLHCRCLNMKGDSHLSGHCSCIIHFLHRAGSWTRWSIRNFQLWCAIILICFPFSSCSVIKARVKSEIKEIYRKGTLGIGKKQSTLMVLKSPSQLSSVSRAFSTTMNAMNIYIHTKALYSGIN